MICILVICADNKKCFHNKFNITVFLGETRNKKNFIKKHVLQFLS